MALPLVVCLWWPSHAEARRLALVIGNDNYQFTEKLANAGHDADAMAQALQAAGFTVTRHRDLTRDALFKAVDAFALSVAKDDEVAVFYSGHGVQIDAAPFLLPVDIQADSARQVTRDALALDSLVADLSKARYTLVVVDACRNNPFAARGLRSLGAERGLQPIEPPEGTAILLSAGRGQTALDTLGPKDTERNGVFTRELLRAMKTPGLQVRDLLLQVRDAVEQRAATVSHKQRPALIDESRGQFYFHPPAASAPAPASTTAAVSEALVIEIAYWNSVQEQGGAQELQLYLRRYPNGRFADLAQARLARLTSVAAAPAAAPVAGASAAQPLTPPDAEGDKEARRFRQLAQKGNASAMAQLGRLYQLGRRGLPRDAVQAVYWYRKGAEAGNGNAMAGLGYMYETGAGGLPRDAAQALDWYRQGAALGDGRAMNNLGAAYVSGQVGVPRDDAAAVEWYRRAAEAGYALGMANLGSMYQAGRGGLPKDAVQAVAWYRRGASAGEGRAMAYLGAAHASGIGGLARDDVEAVAWYRKAIEAGASRGMASLGFMYENGRGGLPKDEAQALAWFRKGAEAGDSLAMSHLGRLYARGGAGLPKDEARAREWYERAAALGSDSARAALVKLK